MKFSLLRIQCSERILDDVSVSHANEFSQVKVRNEHGIFCIIWQDFYGFRICLEMKSFIKMRCLGCQANWLKCFRFFSLKKFSVENCWKFKIFMCWEGEIRWKTWKRFISKLFSHLKSKSISKTLCNYSRFLSQECKKLESRRKNKSNYVLQQDLTSSIAKKKTNCSTTRIESSKFHEIIAHNETVGQNLSQTTPYSHFLQHNSRHVNMKRYWKKKIKFNAQLFSCYTVVFQYCSFALESKEAYTSLALTWFISK